MVEAKIDHQNFTLNGAYKASGLVERITVALQNPTETFRPIGARFGAGHYGVWLQCAR